MMVTPDTDWFFKGGVLIYTEHCIHVCVCVCVYAHMHVCVYIYIHIHTVSCQQIRSEKDKDIYL